MKNFQASEFVDKCTARLHFERNGVQLYEKILTKCPEEFRGRFEKILKDEQKHVVMLEEILQSHGANPFALTPSAKVIDLESRGLLKIANKSDFRELMDTLLSIELVDTANWELLVMMARKLGDKEIEGKFMKALKEETTHLKFIHRHIMKELTGSTKLIKLAG